MNVLIITVGTRQVGWRCRDGIVRCFGADGDRNHPSHLDELYREIGMQRGEHEPGNENSRWSVRHLGEQYYHWCELTRDFSPVELLLDGKLIENSLQQGLKHVILWGTNQPETVRWFYRRADTLWLAELMAGKIRQTWPDLEVDVWSPEVPADQPKLIRKEVEEFILQYALDYLDPSREEPLVLGIENKGSAPAIANTLVICAAGLARECKVQIVAPQEPKPLYHKLGQAYSSRPSEEVEIVAIGEYFWPIERTRIISAWERGDFTEAKVWLAAHQNQYFALYRLSDKLALAANWQIAGALKHMRDGWLAAKTTRQLVPPEQIQTWREQIRAIVPATSNSETVESLFLLTRESCFLIDLALWRQNYTAAFVLFAQTLERLIYLQYEADGWLGKGYVQPPDFWRDPSQYNPSFRELCQGWCKSRGLDENSVWYKTLNAIREKRNQSIHTGQPFTLVQMRSVWTDSKLLSTNPSDDTNTIAQLMQETLRRVCANGWPIPEKPLLRSIYDWSLSFLRSDNASQQ